MRDVRSKGRASWLVSVALVTGSLAVAPPPTWAASLCFSNTAGDQFVVRGIGARLGKSKSKPVSGYVILASGTGRPLSGAFVASASGTGLAVGLTEHQVSVIPGGNAGGTNATTFHQVFFSESDGKLLAGRLGTDCSWPGNSGGTPSGGCERVTIIDCKTVPDIP